MPYCTYDMLNMFRALLCPSSGTRDYMCVVTAYGVQCNVLFPRGLGCFPVPIRFHTFTKFLHSVIFISHISNFFLKRYKYGEFYEVKFAVLYTNKMWW